MANMDTEGKPPDLVDHIRTLCLSLPESGEKEAWDDPTWRVGGRIYAMQKGNSANTRPSLWLKVPKEDQAALIESGHGCYFVPPYVGHKGWIGVYLDDEALNLDSLDTLVEQSYRLIAPKRLVNQLEGGGRCKGPQG